MRMAFAAALVALGMVAAPNAGEARDPQGRWSGFYLGAGFGFADVSSDVSLSAASTTTTFNTCEIIPGVPLPNPAVIADNGSFSVTCVGDASSNPGPLNALFPNHNVGTISAPFNIISATVDQLNSLAAGDAKWQGSVIVGFDQHLSPSLVAGLFADLSRSGSEASFSVTGPAATMTGQLQFDYLATVGARLGWLVPNQNGLLYLYGGYTYADAGNSGATVTTGQGSTSVRFDNFHGFSVGGGGEVQLGKGWFARLDYRYTHLNSQSFGFSHSSSSTVPDGSINIYSACAGSPPGGPGGVDCQRFKTTESATSGAAQIDPEIHAVQMIFGYRF